MIDNLDSTMSPEKINTIAIKTNPPNSSYKEITADFVSLTKTEFITEKNAAKRADISA